MRYFPLAIAGLAITLASCNSASTISPVPGKGVSTIGAGSVRAAERSQWPASVFISDTYVNVYAPRNHGKLRQTIDSYTGNANGLAEDRSGNLWVASLAQEGVYEFAPKSDQPMRFISQKQLQEWPEGVAICPDGEIYVSDLVSEGSPRVGAVFVYDYDTLYQLAEVTPSDFLQGGFVQCDSNSNVYLDYYDKNGEARFVTTPAGSYGSWTPMPMKLPGTVDFKVMRSGDIVVPNVTEVDFYHATAKTPYRTIGGFSGATDLAFLQGEKTLWVLDTSAHEAFEIDVASGATIGAIKKKLNDNAVDILVTPADQR